MISVIIKSETCLHALEAFDSITSCMWPHFDTFVFCLVPGSTYCYTEAMEGQWSGVIEILLFQNQVYLIAKEMLVAPFDSGML